MFHNSLIPCIETGMVKAIGVVGVFMGWWLRSIGSVRSQHGHASRSAQEPFLSREARGG